MYKTFKSQKKEIQIKIKIKYLSSHGWLCVCSLIEKKMNKISLSSFGFWSIYWHTHLPFQETKRRIEKKKKEEKKERKIK